MGIIKKIGRPESVMMLRRCFWPLGPILGPAH
jgi:hypothetical protein